MKSFRVLQVRKSMSRALTLYQMQLENWRWAAAQVFTTCVVVPCLGMAGMGAVAASADRELVSYIYVGNLVMGIMFGTLTIVSVNMAFMMFSGMIIYFKTLPVSMLSLVLATAASFSTLAVPGVVLSGVFGALYLHVTLLPNLLLLAIVPTVLLPMALIGALIGIYSKSFDMASILNFVCTIVMTIAGAVAVPPSRLPVWLVALGHVNPAYHASRIVRSALVGGIGPGELMTSMVVLVVLAICAGALVRAPLLRRE